MTAGTNVRRRVLIVEADRATFELFEEWLEAEGIQAIDAHRDVGDEGEDPRAACDVALVDVRFPREQGVELLRAVAGDHPGTPILALSSGFFGNVACAGPCAIELGVAGVLPKPVTRQALVDAVRGVLPER